VTASIAIGPAAEPCSTAHRAFAKDRTGTNEPALARDVSSQANRVPPRRASRSDCWARRMGMEGRGSGVATTALCRRPPTETRGWTTRTWKY